jgi:ElaB/YqjD/DUF883 family membrane-anchored ribosome-binding protein
MKRSNLLGLVFAAACVAAAAPAFAGGKVEDARQIYSSDVTNAYKDAVKCFETGASCDGAAALKTLRERASKLSDQSRQIWGDLNAMKYPYQAWDTADKEVSNLYVEADNLMRKASNKEQVRLDDLRSKFENAGSALERGHNALREYGKRLVEIRGTVGYIKDKYKGGVTNYYRETYKYLDIDDIIKINKVGATDSLKMLGNETREWNQLRNAVDVQIQNISTPEPLKGILNLQANAITFRTAQMDISSKFGDSSLSLDTLKRELDRMKRSYEQLGADIENGESAIRAYQERMLIVCDTCR